MKKKDLKQKGLGNKLNAAQPVETENIEKMWPSGAIGFQNPRSLLNLVHVWWNNVTHLGMRGIKEQHDCQPGDFTVTEQYTEYKERQTKNCQEDEPTATKQARTYNNKIWRTDGGERDPHRAFIEYVGYRQKGDNVPGNFYPSPVDSPKSNVWYKIVSTGTYIHTYVYSTSPRGFSVVEIHWQSKLRVLCPLPPWTANSQIPVVAKRSSKRSVMISTH